MINHTALQSAMLQLYTVRMSSQHTIDTMSCDQSHRSPERDAAVIYGEDEIVAYYRHDEL